MSSSLLTVSPNLIMSSNMKVSLLKVSPSDKSLISVSLLIVSLMKVFFWSVSLRTVSHNIGVFLMRVSFSNQCVSVPANMFLHPSVLWLTQGLSSIMEIS